MFAVNLPESSKDVFNICAEALKANKDVTGYTVHSEYNSPDNTDHCHNVVFNDGSAITIMYSSGIRKETMRELTLQGGWEKDEVWEKLVTEMFVNSYHMFERE